MDSKQIRSSVFAKTMRFNELCQPLHQELLKDTEKLNQPIQKYSDFKVIPIKELCRVYLQKPNLLASNGIIDALTKPPHNQIHWEMMANHRKFGRIYDQQNLKLKLRNHTSVDSLKPKIGKKVNSLRCFSPLGLGSGSYLRDKKKRLYFSLDKKSNEMKKLSDGTTFSQKKHRVTREVSSKLKFSTSRDDSVLRFERIYNDKDAADDEIEDSLDCSNASSGSQTNSEDAHQPSPVSVLEPMFYEDMLNDDKELPHLDFHGLQKQLDTLKSESYSDGRGMEVSSDEESVIDSDTKESKDSEPIVFLDIQESRDSSYISDILSEVILRDKNWVPNERNSLDLVITSKIFKKLEKKYYTEASWKRSERRILFDRVSSGLVEIIKSIKATTTWKKPVSRRLGTVLSTRGLKQELCKVLARQEKRAKKQSLAKMPVIEIDEWLELESDDESVVCELESMLVDELLAEVVSFM